MVDSFIIPIFVEQSLKQTVMKQIIIEQGVEYEVSNEDILKLKEKDMIYFCPECNVYHLTVDTTIEEMNETIKQTL